MYCYDFSAHYNFKNLQVCTTTTYNIIFKESIFFAPFWFKNGPYCREEAFKKQVMHDRKSNFRNGQLVPMDRALSHLQTNVGSLLFWHKNRTTSYQKKRQIPIETTEERGLTVSREKVSHPMMDLYRGSSYNAILSNADFAPTRFLVENIFLSIGVDFFKILGW